MQEEERNKCFILFECNAPFFSFLRVPSFTVGARYSPNKRHKLLKYPDKSVPIEETGTPDRESRDKSVDRGFPWFDTLPKRSFVANFAHLPARYDRAPVYYCPSTT